MSTYGLQLMTPEDVVVCWDEWKPVLRKAIPVDENADTVLANILTLTQQYRAQVWVGYKADGENGTPLILGVTSGMDNPIAEQGILWVYAVAAWDETVPKPLGLWREGLKRLKDFMKHHGYTKLMGQTKRRGMAHLARALDGQAKTLVEIGA